MNEYLKRTERKVMIAIEQRRGSFCEYDSKFCQEGCEIYLKKSAGTKAQNPRAQLKLQELAK